MSSCNTSNNHRNNNNDDDNDDDDDNDNDDSTRRKRGMKPRSKRNRKRARTHTHPLLAEATKIAFKYSILPLLLPPLPQDQDQQQQGQDQDQDQDETQQQQQDQQQQDQQQQQQQQQQQEEITNDDSDEPVVYVRAIDPYPYTFSTFAKARWLGRTILDVYCSEFGSYPKSYYEAAIRQGKIQVSDQDVTLDYKIKGQDVLSHTVHRHEPGVVVASPKQDPPLVIVAETEELLVVDKPGTLPVHPCGAYQQNSLLPILEPTYGKLHIIHRLDRLTSGLLLLAKNSKVAQRWGKAVMQRDMCEKVYLARVKGKFPLNPLPPSTLSQLTRINSNNHDNHDNDTSIVKNGIHIKCFKDMKEKELSTQQQRERNALGFWITNQAGVLDKDSSLEDVFHSQLSIDDWLDSTDSNKANNNNNNMQHGLCYHLACPTRIANHKDGICEAGSFSDLSDDAYTKSVKAAQTSFGVVHYDQLTDSTILICRPQTGRTHQIRLHLQYLGHPIANDPCYGGDLWYGNRKGQLACQRATARLQQLNATPAGHASNKTAPVVPTISDTPATDDEIEQLAKVMRDTDEPIQAFIQRTCVWCARTGGNDVERTKLELLVRSQGIWLHALKYKMTTSDGKVLDYRTKAPIWSQANKPSDHAKE